MHCHRQATVVLSSITASLLLAGSITVWLPSAQAQDVGSHKSKDQTQSSDTTARTGEVSGAPAAEPIDTAAGETTTTDTSAVVASGDDTQTDEQTEEQSAEEAAAEAQREKELAESEAYEHYVLGNYYMQKWDMPMAEIELDQAVCSNPVMLAAHRDLCLVSLMRCNMLRSLAEFMMVVGLGEPIPYTPVEKGKMSNQALVAHYKKGLTFARENNWKEARTELEWALTYGENDYAVHHSLAFAYSNLGDYARAEQEYQETFKNAPHDALAHADLADMLAKSGQSARAQAEMTTAVQLSPQAAALHIDLGWIAESRGDIGTAASEFRTACGISPKHAGLWMHLGKLLEKQGHSDQAMEAYSKALALKPDEIEAKNSLERLKQRAS